MRMREAPVSWAVARSSSSCLVWASAPAAVSAWRAASAASARSGSPPMSQRPSLAMPIGTRSNRFRSMAAITEAAPARDTSCSPERPPKTTPTRSFRTLSAIDPVVSDALLPGENSFQPSGGLLLLTPRPPLGEALGELLLGPARGGAVVDAAAERVGQVLLAHLRVGGVVRVLIPAAVAQIGHQAGGRVAQMQ